MEIQDKKLYVLNLLCIFSVCSFLIFGNCKSNSKRYFNNTGGESMPPVNSTDSIAKQFNQLKEAIIKGEKNRIKSYFDFPINNSDFWYKVLDDEEVESYIDKPFIEKDFYNYYDRIFTKEFKACLSSVNVGILSKKGAFRTPFLIDKDKRYFTKNQIYATCNQNELKLKFISVVQDEIENGDHTEIYTFKLFKGKLKLVNSYMTD